jgi:DHA1 family multidrug resistance protein-like MFS transporter
MTKTVIRPLHMLFTEPIVSFVCLYSSFQFALLYTFVVASPYVFSTAYGFGLGDQGLSFLGFVTGCAIAPIGIIMLDRTVYQRKYAQFKETETGSKFPPEHRLYCAMAGSIILPTGLFWFAWTVKPSIHWIVPIIAQAFAILGSVLVYVGANFYMMDTYGPVYGASAAGATSLSRYTLAATFPLFTLQMYSRLGVGWATSLLGLCTILMAPIPWAFYHWGPKLRARSSYEHES